MIEVGMPIAQIQLGEDTLRVLVRSIGLALVAGALGLGIGILHRWYAREQVPEGLAVLIGLSAVAIYLNTTTALGEVIGGDFDALSVEAALLNVAVFAAAGVAASVGGRAGDRLGESILRTTGGRVAEGDLSAVVRAVGRVIAVELPAAASIRDIEGYDAVGPDVKEKLGGKTLLFPRRLTLDALHERLVTRLQTDYGIGHIDVDITEEGHIEYLAIGSREAGLGPTLPPETCALAVRADPAFAASPGDVVQVWARSEEGSDRVTTAEVRGTAGDTVTLAVDAADADRLDSERRYRLVTLPVEPRADREFASLLRAAAETMGVTSITEGSPLVGTPVGALDVAVVAVRPESGPIVALPRRSRPLAAGETLYAIDRPDNLRRLEVVAGARGGGVGTPDEALEADESQD